MFKLSEPYRSNESSCVLLRQLNKLSIPVRVQLASEDTHAIYVPAAEAQQGADVRQRGLKSVGDVFQIHHLWPAQGCLLISQHLKDGKNVCKARPENQQTAVACVVSCRGSHRGGIGGCVTNVTCYNHMRCCSISREYLSVIVMSKYVLSKNFHGPIAKLEF